MKVRKPTKAPGIFIEFTFLLVLVFIKRVYTAERTVFMRSSVYKVKLGTMRRLLSIVQKTCIYISAFGVYNNKQENVSGIQHYLAPNVGPRIVHGKFECR